MSDLISIDQRKAIYLLLKDLYNRQHGSCLKVPNTFKEWVKWQGLEKEPEPSKPARTKYSSFKGCKESNVDGFINIDLDQGETFDLYLDDCKKMVDALNGFLSKKELILDVVVLSSKDYLDLQEKTKKYTDDGYSISCQLKGVKGNPILIQVVHKVIND